MPVTVSEDGGYYPAGAAVRRHARPTRKEKTPSKPRRHRGADRGGRAAGLRPLPHKYPHSWRSKAPVIFRNAPQWFIAVDKDVQAGNRKATLRALALDDIPATRRDPRAGENRIGAPWSGTARTGCCRASAPGRAPIAVLRVAQADGQSSCATTR